MRDFTEILNMTPHTVNLLDCNGNELLAIPSHGDSPRLKSKTSGAGEINGFPLVRQEFGETTGLPLAQDGVLILVSRLVLAANPERKDLGVPCNFVRGEGGHIIGCRQIEVR